ncbi:MAG: hypothetical protein JXR53_03005 [Bacteroidales bacterium]|nr:hypothetical protein [Bacteroidales bacterium]
MIVNKEYQILDGPVKVEQYKILHGANYFSGGPVALFSINLGEYDEVFTNDIPGFFEYLQEKLPSLIEHHCSEGVRGGFYTRLQKGTLLGHVMEHLAIELQNLAGMSVNYGKTRSTLKEAVYNVIFRFRDEEAGILAGKAALNIINSFLNKTDIDIEKILQSLIELREDRLPGPTTQSIIDEAEFRNIPWQRLDDNNLIQLGSGKYSKKVRASLTQNTSAMASDTALDRALCLKFLKEAEIPILPYSIFEENIPTLTANGVYMPRYRGGTNDISLFLDSSALNRAKPKAYQNRELICFDQKEIPVWRFLMINHKIAGVCQLNPARPEADGKMNIRELIAKENKNPLREPGDKGALSYISEDLELLEQIARWNFSVYSIPKEGSTILTGASLNPSSGSSTKTFSGKIHPKIKEKLEKSSRILNIDIAGIDICMENPANDFKDGEGIREVFISPDFRMHLNPAEGEVQNVTQKFLQHLFPATQENRIPLIAVSGSKGKTSFIRILEHLFTDQYPEKGIMSSHNFSIGQYSFEKEEKVSAGNLKILLRDPGIDIAIAEISNEILTEYGLPYDMANCAVFLNSNPDDAEKFGFHCPEDLAYCQHVVAEQVIKNGFSILNADDELVAENADMTDVPVIWISSRNAPEIEKRKPEDMLLYCTPEFIVFEKNKQQENIVRISEIPEYWRSEEGVIYESVLAAIAISILYPNEEKSGLSRILDFIKQSKAWII